MSAVFEIPVKQINDESSPDTVKSWDSLKHINLVISLEEEFEIEFTENEIIEITKILSLNNNFNIILNEDQYFIASDNIDISNQILEMLNKKKLDLKIIELP